MGSLAQLRSVRATGEDRGRDASHQRRRRRAQSTGDRHHRNRAEADQECKALSDPGEHADARPLHHGQRIVLCAALARIAADGTAADDVRRMTIARFRKIALSLPESIEGAHHGTTDFRVKKRIFATLGYPDANWGMVKLTVGQQSVRSEERR